MESTYFPLVCKLQFKLPLQSNQINLNILFYSVLVQTQLRNRGTKYTEMNILSINLKSFNFWYIKFKKIIFENCKIPSNEDKSLQIYKLFWKCIISVGKKVRIWILKVNEAKNNNPRQLCCTKVFCCCFAFANNNPLESVNS